MANRMSFQHADPKRVRRFEVDSTIVVEVGDAMYQAVDDIRPAGQLAYVSANLGQTQANFRRDFKGVAMDSSASGDTADIAVATMGTFEFICVAAQFEIGDRVGMDDNATPDALLDQQVIALTENQYGEIGQVTKRYSANVTRVQVEINPFGQLASQPLFISLGTTLHTSAVDLVTGFSLDFPFKLVSLIAINAVASTGASVLTVDNGGTALDDTLTLTSGASKGVVDRQVMDDATGDDVFDAGDLLDIASDGTASAGEVELIIEIIPFLHHN